MKKTKGKGITQINKLAGRCPYCGRPVTYRSADGIYRDNSRNAMLYVCSNYPECDSYVRVHEGTKIPVGTLANKNLRTLRKQAHDRFNRLYLSGRMSRDDAYAWLASILQAPPSQAHIGHLSEYYCQQVIQESDKLFSNQKQKPGGGYIYALDRNPASAG